MNKKYINHVNLILHTLGGDFTNLYKENFLKVLEKEVELLEKINPKLQPKEKRYNNIICSSLRLATYNQVPEILINLISSIKKEVTL